MNSGYSISTWPWGSRSLVSHQPDFTRALGPYFQRQILICHLLFHTEAPNWPLQGMKMARLCPAFRCPLACKLVVPPGAIIQISSCLHPCRRVPQLTHHHGSLDRRELPLPVTLLQEQGCDDFQRAGGTRHGQPGCLPWWLSTFLLTSPELPVMGWQLLGCRPWHSSSLVILNNHTGTWLLSASTGGPRTARLPPTSSPPVPRAVRPWAPVTWSVISLLGVQSLCLCLGEFVNPYSLMVGERSFPLSPCHRNGPGSHAGRALPTCQSSVRRSAADSSMSPR